MASGAVRRLFRSRQWKTMALLIGAMAVVHWISYAVRNWEAWLEVRSLVWDSEFSGIFGNPVLHLIGYAIGPLFFYFLLLASASILLGLLLRKRDGARHSEGV